MNLNSKYKFVDDCKDIFDEAMSLIDFEGDLVSFKEEFFKKVGGVAISKMYQSLSADVQQELIPTLQGDDYIAVNDKFLPHFTTDKMATIYMETFKLLLLKMFENPDFASIRPEVELLLDNINTSSELIS